MNTPKTTLIDTTIDRVDLSLTVSRAENRKVELYRLTMQKVCYFAAAGDLDADAFAQIAQLQAGTKVRACVYEDRGRRNIAWIRSADHAIAPYDAFAQKRKNLKLLPRAFCVLVLSLAALAIPNAVVMALATVVALISLMGCALAIAGLTGLHRSSRIEAQEIWLREPSGSTATWSGQ